MHDPSFQVFEVHVPIPVVRWKVRATPNGLRRRRWTGGGPEHLGKPMHNPLRPGGWDLVIARRLIGWWNVLEIWHDEPEGRDSGTVCKGHHGSKLDLHNVRWAWRHRRHLHIYSPPVRRMVAWRKQRCAGCGHRFRWKRDARHSLGWSAREVYHSPCASLVTVRSQLEDAYSVLAFDANDNAKWRVGRALDARSEKKAELARADRGEPTP